MPSWCHCHSLSLASVKSRLVLPFWYRPTRVVLEKGPLNVRACVRACMYSAYVLWCCWLGGRKGIRPVKTWVMGCWHGYLSGARCRLADIWPKWCHYHSLSLVSVKSRLVFTFLVPAHPDGPGQRAFKYVRACVCACVYCMLQSIKISCYHKV